MSLIHFLLAFVGALADLLFSVVSFWVWCFIARALWTGRVVVIDPNAPSLRVERRS